MVPKRRGTRKMLGACAFGMGLVGCTDGGAVYQSAPIEIKDKSGIINGEAISESSDLATHTVLLVRQGSLGGGYSVAFCTGVLLSPKIVLTAAHCVKRSDQRTIFLFQNLPENFSLASSNLSALAYSTPRRIILHALAERDDDFEQIDLAMLETHEAAPKFQPLQVAELKDTMSVTAVGFGFQSPVPASQFIQLRKTNLPLLTASEATRLAKLIALNSQEVQDSEREEYKDYLISHYRPSQTSPYLLTNQMKSADEEVSRAQTGICLGDSGGPLFDSNQAKSPLVGIMVKSVTIMANESTCGDAGFSIRLYEQREWIDEVFNFLNQTENQSLFPTSEPRSL